MGDGRLSRKRAPHRSPPWARGRRARVCDHPELGVDAPSAPAYIRERSRALPVCDYLRQARQTTLGESGVAKPAECDLQGILQQCTIFINIYTHYPPDGGPDKAKFGFVRIPYLVAQLWPCCCLPLSPTNGLRSRMPPTSCEGAASRSKDCVYLASTN